MQDRTQLLPKTQFERNLTQGLRVLTHYSGLDAPIEALRALVGAAKDAGMRLPVYPVKAVHAADIQERARAIIMSIPDSAPNGTAQEHVYGDMLERWPEAVVQQLEPLRNLKTGEDRTTQAPYSTNTHAPA